MAHGPDWGLEPLAPLLSTSSIGLLAAQSAIPNASCTSTLANSIVSPSSPDTAHQCSRRADGVFTYKAQRQAWAPSDSRTRLAEPAGPERSWCTLRAAIACAR